MFRHPTSYLPSYLLRQASLWLHDVFNARASLRLMLLPIAGLCWLCVWYVLALMAAVDFILKATRLLISTAITEFILRPRRLVSMALCYVLVAAFLAPLVTANSRSSPVNAQGQTRHGTPVGGPPAADLPNLDEVRRKRHAKPQAPPHMFRR